eukprot:366243-Chlamydomonas_euryale.AAC.8
MGRRARARAAGAPKRVRGSTLARPSSPHTASDSYGSRALAVALLIRLSRMLARVRVHVPRRALSSPPPCQPWLRPPGPGLAAEKHDFHYPKKCVLWGGKPPQTTPQCRRLVGHPETQTWCPQLLQSPMPPATTIQLPSLPLGAAAAVPGVRTATAAKLRLRAACAHSALSSAVHDMQGAAARARGAADAVTGLLGDSPSGSSGSGGGGGGGRAAGLRSEAPVFAAASAACAGGMLSEVATMLEREVALRRRAVNALAGIGTNSLPHGADHAGAAAAAPAVLNAVASAAAAMFGGGGAAAGEAADGADAAPSEAAVRGALTVMQSAWIVLPNVRPERIAEVAEGLAEDMAGF